MQIKLKNVGIIADSTIEMEGLTVITGKNKSGKTTVGKAFYSIIDAVSSLRRKFQADKTNYIYNKLMDLRDQINSFDYIFTMQEKEEEYTERFPNIGTLTVTYLSDYSNMDMEKFARDLLKEFETIDINEIEKCKDFPLWKAFYESQRKASVIEAFSKERIDAIQYINQIFIDIRNDYELIQYSRECINQTLQMEFSGQIQPAKHSDYLSEISFSNREEHYFEIAIKNNQIVDNGERVFYSSPIKNVFFIDDPYVLDGNKIDFDRALKKTLRFTGKRIEGNSIVDYGRIIPHQEKMARIVKANASPSVLEQVVINEKVRKIKEIIDNILPGTYEFGSSGDYYIEDGVRLQFTNLATGSKLFSVIKILLEAGKLDEKTLLILDEPEAHLHPEWQNVFAEIIILLVKELDLKVLLTSHSSNFVLAIDAYMRKHGINEKSRFYQTVDAGDGMVRFQCVDDNLSSIYQDFLNYFSKVKAIRDSYVED